MSIDLLDTEERLPTSEELPCSDDTPVDNERANKWKSRFKEEQGEQGFN